MLTSYDFSLITIVCEEAVPDLALGFARRDLEELQPYQQVGERCRNGSSACVLLARRWLGILLSNYL